MLRNIIHIYMTNTEIIIPPHSLWITSVEEDNRNLDLILRNNGTGEVNFEVKVETPENFEIRCINDMDEISSTEMTKEFRIPSERQDHISFGFRYLGNDHREDVLKVTVSDGVRETSRTYDIVLFEN